MVQVQNYPENADPRVILNALRIRYVKSMPNEKRENEATFSAPWNIALPIEYYFF